MKQKLLTIPVVLALSACGNTTTTYYPFGKPEPGHLESGQLGFSDAMFKGVLKLSNLSEGYSYSHKRYKKDNGEVAEEYKIAQLPDVASILQPEFSSKNLIKEYLQNKGADLSRTGTFFPGEKNGHLSSAGATMSGSDLKEIMRCDAFENPVGQKKPDIIANIYKTVLARSKESVLLIPVWRNQTEDGGRRLYDIMVSAAYDAAKKDSGLRVTLFATSKEEKDLLSLAIDRKSSELKKAAPSAALSGGHTTAASHRLASGQASLHQAFGGYNVAGVAADFGGFKAMGVMSGQSHRQGQTTLLLGQQFGSCFYAVGMEFGTEQNELSYSAAKAMTFFNVHQNWTLSAGVATVSEKIMMPFNGAKSVERAGVMSEIGVHFTQLLQGFKLMGDVGARVFYGEQTQSAWFTQVSLVNAAVKTSAFVSSIDAGINFSYEY
jgi:hypothetical protein